MKYICFSCEKEVELDIRSRIRCPFCGGRILYKKKPEVKITVDVN